MLKRSRQVRDDLLRLALPQQPAIDEDAGELVADRLVDHRGRDRAVDAAGQAADHPALPDLGADARDPGLAEPGHAPAAGEPGDTVGEVLQQLPPVRGVDDLRMELHAVVAAGVVGDGGERRALAACHDAEARAAAGSRGRRGSSRPARARPAPRRRGTARSPRSPRRRPGRTPGGR